VCGIAGFNGQIHNACDHRAELERDGYRFRSDTDTEVILALYERVGLSACSNGSTACSPSRSPTLAAPSSICWATGSASNPQLGAVRHAAPQVLRFCFAKKDDTLEQAADRLSRV
jgi:hypothetical protein